VSLRTLLKTEKLEKNQLFREFTDSAELTIFCVILPKIAGNKYLKFQSSIEYNIAIRWLSFQNRRKTCVLTQNIKKCPKIYSWLFLAHHTVSLCDHVAASSSVSGARFATTEWISFKLGYLAPPGITPRGFFHFRDLTYFMQNTPLFCANMFLTILFPRNFYVSCIFGNLILSYHMLDCPRKKLLLSPGGARGQNVTGKQLTGLNYLWEINYACESLLRPWFGYLMLIKLLSLIQNPRLCSCFCKFISVTVWIILKP
jgi:hypothetical protein